MRIAAVTLLLLSSTYVFAESKNCLYPSLAVPDGRVVNSQFEGTSHGNNPQYWYAFYGQATHSYSLEFVPTVDNENNNVGISFTNLTAWGPGDIAGLQGNDCFVPTTLSLTATQAFSPAVAHGKYGAGQRISFTQPTSGLVILTITNLAAAGGYSYRITDTTLSNARWTTYSGYETQWNFVNLSDMTITGTFFVYATSGQLLWTGTITVPSWRMHTWSTAARV